MFFFKYSFAGLSPVTPIMTTIMSYPIHHHPPLLTQCFDCILTTISVLKEQDKKKRKEKKDHIWYTCV